MRPERVLVTGGTGVVGAWVVRGLYERGVTPIVFTRGQTEGIGGAINGDLAGRLVAARGDVLDRESIERAVSAHGAQAIIHMASAKPWQMERPFVPESRPREAIQQIALGTLNVLDAARATGVHRVVYASSKAVFGDVDGEHSVPCYRPLPAEHPRLPRMLYGIGKVAAEDLGRYYREQHGMQFTSIRFSSSYGPLKRGPTEVALEGALMAAARGMPVRLRAYTGGQKEDYTYNKDVAQAFVLAALSDRRLAWAYNIGSGRLVDHEVIARAILHHLPDADIDVVDPDEGPTVMDRARCLMDYRAATEDLGYRPRWAALDEAFGDFLAEEGRIGRVQEAAADR